MLGGLVLLFGACSSENQLSDSQYVELAQESLNQGELRVAGIQLKNALVVNPDNMRARWLLGKLYLDLGESAAAEKEFRRALEAGIAEESVLPLLAKALLAQGRPDEVLSLSAKNASALAGGEFIAARALAYLEKGEIDPAEREIERAAGVAPDSPYVATAKARILLTTGRKAEGRGLLDSVVERSPGYAWAWSLIGDLEAGDGSREQAVGAYSKSIEARAGNSNDRVKRSMLNIELKRFAEAQKDIAVLKEQNRLAGDYTQGVMYLAEGEYAAARDALVGVRKSKPDYLMTTTYLAFAHYALGDLEQAEHLARESVRAHPESPFGRRLLAMIRAGRGQFADVERLLQPVLRQQPEDVFSLNLLATASLRLGNTEESVSLLRRVAQIQPESAVARTRLGAGLLLSGEAEEGVSQLDTAISLDSSQQQAEVLLILNHLRTKELDKALAAAQAYKERNPDVPLPYTLIGLLYQEQGKEAAAVEWFLKADELAPGDPAANTYLAELALKSEKWDDARAYFERILTYNADHLSTLIRLAKLEARAGNAIGMENRLRSAIAAHPAAVPPRLVLSRYLLYTGKAQQALQLLEEVPEPSSRRQAYLEALGSAQLANDRLEDARRTLQRLVEINPKSAKAHFLLGRIYAAEGDAQEVEAALEATLRVQPGHLLARLAYTRMLLRRGDIEGAEASLDMLKATAGKNPDVKYLEGLIASAKNHPEQARIALREAFDEAPTKSVLLALARQHWLEGDRAASVGLLEQWVSDHPVDVASRLALAEAYLKSDRVDDAIGQYQAVLKSDRENVLALNNLAWHLQDSQPAEALKYIKRAVEVAPQSSTVLDTYAMVLAKNRDFVLAERTIDRALSRKPDDPTLMYRKAVILALGGKKPEAASILSELLSKENSFPEKVPATQLLDHLRKSN